MILGGLINIWRETKLFWRETKKNLAGNDWTSCGVYSWHPHILSTWQQGSEPLLTIGKFIVLSPKIPDVKQGGRERTFLY